MEEFCHFQNSMIIIPQYKRVSKMPAPLVACREPVGVQNRQPSVP